MGICYQNEKSDCLSDLLTLRELEVLELLSDGSSTDEIANDEIAIRLAVSGSKVDADRYVGRAVSERDNVRNREPMLVTSLHDGP
jgi:hypothetical protein